MESTCASLPMEHGFIAARRLVGSLLDKCQPIISGAVPTIDLPADELAAVPAAIRGVIEDDKFPHAPRLDPLRAALARLDAAGSVPSGKPDSTSPPDPKAPPPAKADKRAPRASRPLHAAG
jgi:hypothetical protein